MVVPRSKGALVSTCKIDYWILVYRNSSMAYWGAHCCLVKVVGANFVEFFMNSKRLVLKFCSDGAVDLVGRQRYVMEEFPWMTES